MLSRSPVLLVIGGALMVGAAVHGQVDEGPGPVPGILASQQQRTFLRAHPGAAFARTGQRITRVYGQAFASGRSALESAENFLVDESMIFGVDAEDLVAGGIGLAGTHVQPIMYDAAANAYRFTGLFYRQERDGVPVYGAQVKLLVRNEAGFPLVLVAADLRDLGNFQVDKALAEVDPEQLRVVAAGALDPAAQIRDHRLVIWAGVDEMNVTPRAAYDTVVGIDIDRWRLIIDAATSAVLYTEHLIYDIDIDGQVAGRSTEGVGAEQCEEEIPFPMPYMRVTAGVDSAFTAADGSFTIPHAGGGSVTVDATMDGIWFDVLDFFGNDETLSQLVSPPGPASFMFNDANSDPFPRAQVNAYVHSNIIRDMVIQQNPAYPTLDDGDFLVNVNRTDGFCPGNAWYSPGDVTINFCQAGDGHPNTSWSSVIYHEYGHHLVAAAGSGQGQYGEGLGDVMSVIILDSPDLGLGFFGPCGQALRTADNSHQYPCNGGSHDCGQLLSGCVWDTRNQLVITEPADYQDIIKNLAVNAILVHSGSTITPQITIDFLTLDDDNANIFDGTPHYDEIQAGFSVHNMPGPVLVDITFQFPGGLPDLVAPSGNETVSVEVVGVLGSPQPGTGTLHVSSGGAAGFTAIPMVEVEPNIYDAVFPAFDCGASVSYYFSAETTGGDTETWPVDAPASTLQAIAATDVVVEYAEDFETNAGWSVADSPGLVDGGWDFGVPVDCNRGDPPTDADGSGSAALTDNSAGDNCNSDVDDGTTTLTSPALDASDEASYISYYRWYDNTFGNAPNADTFLVEVSPSGLGWAELETVGPGGPEAGGGWVLKQFRVGDFVPNTSTFRIRFHASDLADGSVVEAGVDGVTIQRFVCDDEPDPCPADTNGDGVVDVQDLTALIVAWGTADPDADIDGSGTVDVQDLTALITAWGDCI